MPVRMQLVQPLKDCQGKIKERSFLNVFIKINCTSLIKELCSNTTDFEGFKAKFLKYIYIFLTIDCTS